MRFKRGKNKRGALFCLFFCFLLLATVFGLRGALAAWQEPTAQPPEENLPGYLTVSGDHQARSGRLRLGSDDLSNINYQLEVKGSGAEMEDTVVTNDLTVDTDTLYVDSANNRVGIGTLTPSDRLTVQGDVTITGISTGLAAWGDSTTEPTAYGTTTSNLHAGVAGVGTAATNYGVYGFNVSGTAVEGENTGTNKSPVYGQATSGVGVYGDNTCGYTMASTCGGVGLWAGYFDGRLESTSDVSGAKFLPTTPRPSLVPFTFGQLVAEYGYEAAAPYDSAPAVQYFDGTYVWAFGGTKLHKIRASDGFKIAAFEVGASPTSVIFDGQYVWVTAGSTVKKLDPYSGAIICQNTADLTNARSLAFDGRDFWVLDWVAAIQRGKVIKVNNNVCTKVSEIGLTSGIDVSDGKIIFNGSFLWVTGRDASNNGIIFNINPSSLKAVGWSDLVAANPQDIFFDNYYYWVANRDSDSLTKFYLSYKVCTNDYNPANERSCTVDSDCDITGGDGACFAKAQPFGTYSVDSNSQPSRLAFDGTGLWVSTRNGVTRLLAADPSVPQAFSLNFAPTGLVFDGTYLWASESGTNIDKLYSGTGYGVTDLSGTLTLQQNSPLIQQNGSINIDGSGRIGGDTEAQGELTVTTNNVWGEEEASDVIDNDGSSLGQGTHTCPDGHFVKNIVTNGAGEVIRIECRPL